MHNLELPDFATRGAEYEYLAANRWPDGKVAGPRCQTTKITKATQPGYYKCKSCLDNFQQAPFNASTGTALAGYKTPLKAFLYAAYVLNLGKYGLSTLGLSQKMNVTVVTSNKIIQRLGALQREGMGYILGRFAPKYPHKVTTIRGYSAQLAPELPDIDACHYPKTMPEDDLVAPGNPIYVEKEAVGDKYYLDPEDNCVKIKKGFPILTDYKELSETECESRIRAILYPGGQQDCPHCAHSEKSGAGTTGYYRCKQCQRKYNWRTNTVFMPSKLPVKALLGIMAKLHNFRLSVSSYSVARELGLTQKSAYFNIKKIRQALYHYDLYQETQAQLKGPVQYDDKIVRKTASEPYYENGAMTGQRLRTEERVVICCLFDAQTRQFRHLEVGAGDPERQRIIKDWIRANVAQNSILFSDATTLLNEFKGYYNIMRVKHWKAQYARDITPRVIMREDGVELRTRVTNNRVEGFWRKFLEQNNITFQHRGAMKNISYYLSDATRRFAWNGEIRNGLTVALDAMVSAAKYYKAAGLTALRKKYAAPDYFYSAILIPG